MTRTDTTAATPPVEYGECPSCAALMLPVLEMAPCGHRGPSIIRSLTESGIVYSWTRTGGPEPVQLAMVDFFDGALRVSAPMSEGSVAEIGDRVVIVVGQTTPLSFRLVESTRQ